MVASISIITVTLNSVTTLDDCLKSLKNQTMPFEHIVVDGKSDDGTLDIIKEYESQVSRMISETDNGIYDVQVISTPGRLTDHYNPQNKTVNLSEAV